MANRIKMSIFVWVSFTIAASEIAHVNAVECSSPGTELQEVTWAPFKDGKLPPNLHRAGQEMTAGGITSTYVARARVRQFSSGIVPGYLSSFTRTIVITGVEKGPYSMSEGEVLTSEPKWAKIKSGAENIPLKAVPVGRYGEFEPVYSCRAQVGDIQIVGVMWWGQNYCHTLVGSKGPNGVTYEDKGSKDYEILVV